MKEFLDLGKQPMANNFVNVDQFDDEYSFNLKMGFDTETFLVSQINRVQPEKMFNDKYPYDSSLSRTMQEHFSKVARKLQERFSPKKTIEIGSNSGEFIKHFPKNSICVEPCNNFADKTQKMGYETYSMWWNTTNTDSYGFKPEYDLIYSANCLCHIPDIEDAFKAAEQCLSKNGVLVIEDPSMLEVIKTNQYQQFYDEHVHIFSLLSIKNIAGKSGLRIFDVENLTTHGGSNRIYLSRQESNSFETSPVEAFNQEVQYGLDSLSTYEKFADRVAEKRCRLKDLLDHYKHIGYRVIGYGATAKANTVYSYCSIDSSHIEYILDTTPDKQGKFTPLTHIPIYKYHPSFMETADVAYLGAYNYLPEIMGKEFKWLSKKGRFLVDVPNIKLVGVREYENLIS